MEHHDRPVRRALRRRAEDLATAARTADRPVCADREYAVVVPDYLYSGGDGYNFPADRPVSKSGSELTYLVLDAIMVAQAEGRKIGVPVDPDNPRIVLLQGSSEPCFE